LFLAFQFFDLQAFSFAGGLCRGSVSEDALNTALFFFVFGFCSFSTELA
jgi:hypothetical protein